MAKGKKSSGKHYTSKGERVSVDRAITKAVRRDRTLGEKEMNLIRAYEEHRNPWVTIPNPNPKDTRARFIRIRADELWGKSKENVYKMRQAPA